MIPAWQRPVAVLAGTHRREAALVAGGLGLVYWVLQVSTPRVIGLLFDDAVYLALGKAIAEGHGYRSIYAVGEPVHLRYPPGLPGILALLWRIFGSVHAVAAPAVALSVAATAGGAALLWWMARARLGLHPWIAAVCALSPFFLDAAVRYFSLPISEPYLVLGWAGALTVAYRLRERPSPASAALLGLVVAVTILTRTQAVGVFAGILVTLAVQRTNLRHVGAFLIAALLPLALWAWWHGRMVVAGPISTQPDEGSYLSWVPLQHPSRLLSFGAAAFRLTWPLYWEQFARYLTDVRALGLALLSMFCGLGVAGSALAGRPHAALTLTLAANAAIVLFWPWPQDRFVLPLLPFAGLLVAVAIQAAVRPAAPRVRIAAHATLGFLALSVAARQVTLRGFAHFPVSPQAVSPMPYPSHFMTANARFIRVASNWLSEHTMAEDRVLTDAAAAIYLYTGRHTVAALPAESRLQPSVFEIPGRYLASRIVADSVTVVVLTYVHHPLARDVATLYYRCPGALQDVGNALWWAGTARAFFYRVRRDDGCLAPILHSSP